MNQMYRRLHSLACFKAVATLILADKKAPRYRRKRSKQGKGLVYRFHCLVISTSTPEVVDCDLLSYVCW